jgi:sortase A
MRRYAVVLAALLACFGLWQLGQGAWIHVKARVAQHLLQRAWARELGGEVRAAPWPWADTWPVARLRVPAHGVDLVVLEGVSGRTLAFGPGHVESTAAPGTAGTSVLSGHRDTHFHFLAALRRGEEIVVERRDGRRVRYRVSETAAIDARRAVVRAGGAEPALVLLTCYPFDAVVPGGPQRWAVVARAVVAPSLVALAGGGESR